MVYNIDNIDKILMENSVSKEQIIEIMYSALSIMQRYNGNTVEYCLEEAIKDSDLSVTPEKNKEDHSEISEIMKYFTTSEDDVEKMYQAFKRRLIAELAVSGGAHSGVVCGHLEDRWKINI